MQKESAFGNVYRISGYAVREHFQSQKKFGIRSATSSYPYAAIAACQMELAPHLTQVSPPTHRFRLCDLEAGDLFDRLKLL